MRTLFSNGHIRRKNVTKINCTALPCLLFHSGVAEWSFLSDIDSRKPRYLDLACVDHTEDGTLSQTH